VKRTLEVTFKDRKRQSIMDPVCDLGELVKAVEKMQAQDVPTKATVTIQAPIFGQKAALVATWESE
jgi:hypothetical protein